MKLFFVIPQVLTLASAAALLVREEKVNYNGFKVFRIDTGNDLQTIQEELATFSLEPWNIDASKHMDVAISPPQLSSFEALSLNVTVMHEDLGADISAEFDAAADAGLRKRALPAVTWFNSYHAYNDHIQFLRDLQSALPSNSEVITSGTSVQGRAITGIHLWGKGGKSTKPAIVFHGNVHAREWITSMTVEYLAYQLVSGYGNDASATSFLDAYDWYILPLVNPDGFVYSQTTDRLWRKNRSAAPSGSRCLGTDINRNWPYQWDVPGGSSTDPCDQTYRGRTAGDSPEISGLTSLLTRLRDTTGIKLYVDWHSYGQYILTPYGYSCSAKATNQAKHDSLAAGTGNAIRTAGGTRWTTGPSCSTLYATSGSSTDWVGDVAKAEFSITFELRDTGTNGFVLPASQILPSGQEQWAGVKYLIPNL